MKNELLEERVEKLEYYMRLMREFVKDQEVFEFWEWIMNYDLNEYEANEILSLTKDYNNRLRINDTIKFDEYYYEIEDILKKNEQVKKYINRIFVKQMLESLRKLMFKRLISELLNDYNENYNE